MFLHHNLHKFTWTSPVLDVQSFRGADYDADHYWVVTKVWERLAVSKQITQRFHMERFNVKKSHEVEGKEQYHTEISNRFAALENLDIDVAINRAWETFQPKRGYIIMN
jgi:hypothetical protein